MSSLNCSKSFFLKRYNLFSLRSLKTKGFESRVSNGKVYTTLWSSAMISIFCIIENDKVWLNVSEGSAGGMLGQWRRQWSPVDGSSKIVVEERLLKPHLERERERDRRRNFDWRWWPVTVMFRERIAYVIFQEIISDMYFLQLFPRFDKVQK